jgi:uncharacterized membrane protein YgcG
MTSRITFLLLPAMLLVACGDDEKKDGANQAPIADAGPNQSVSAASIVTLSGSGSYDPDGDPLTFVWTFDGVPEGSALEGGAFAVNNTADVATSFSPDELGSYVISLTVTDGLGNSSSPDRTLVEVLTGDAPVANAGEDHTTNTGIAVSLDGTESFDPIARDLNYTWELAKAPAESALTKVNNSTSDTARITPDVAGLYVVSLVVDNGLLHSEADTAVIRASVEDTEVPIAVAGEDLDGMDCTHISVDGTGSSDPDGADLTYLWDLQSRPAGSAATTGSFGNRADAKTSFFPDVAGDYVLSLSVFDGESWSLPDELTISARERSYNSVPTVFPGTTTSANAGEAICEEIGYSYICAYCDPVSIGLGTDAIVRDADDDPLTVKWTVLSGSAGIPDPDRVVTEAQLGSSQPLEPDACEPNEYRFELTVTDCTGASSSAQVSHNAICCGITSGGDVEDSGTGGSGGSSGGSGSGGGGGIPDDTETPTD